MKTSAERAFGIVAEALRGAGTVAWEAPEHIRLELAEGTTVRFRLTDRDEAETAGHGPEPVLWVLRSPGAALLRELRSAGESFVALNGAVRITAPGLLVDRTDLKPVGSASGSARRSAFSDRASVIARRLFAHSVESEWTVTSLAEGAGVAPSVASYALADLQRRGLVATRSRGKKRWSSLIDHRALVEAWTREYDWEANARISVSAPIGSPARFLRRLETLRLPRFAATLQAGASLVVSHAPVEQVHLYVDVASRADLSELAERLDWRPDPKGQLHLMQPRYKRSVWDGARVIKRAPVVSELQLVLDLWNHPLRGREQAELLLETHLASLATHGR